MRTANTVMAINAVKSILPVLEVKENAWNNKYRGDKRRLKFIVPTTRFTNRTVRLAARAKIAKKLKRLGVSYESAEFINTFPGNWIDRISGGTYYFSIQMDRYA